MNIGEGKQKYKKTRRFIPAIVLAIPKKNRKRESLRRRCMFIILSLDSVISYRMNDPHPFYCDIMELERLE